MNRYYKKRIKSIKKENNYAYKIENQDDLDRLIKKFKIIRNDSPFIEFTKQNGEITTNPEEINNELFNYYVQSPEDNKMNNNLRIHNLGGKLPLLEEDELIKTIKFNSNDIAPGFDLIGYRMVKHLFKTCKSYFESLYNHLIENVYFPSAFKKDILIFFQTQ